MKKTERLADYKLRFIPAGGEKTEIAFSPVGEYEDEFFTVSATDNGFRRTVTVTAKRDVTIEKCTQRGVARAERKSLVLINGYQSWTKTKEYFLSEKEHNVKRLPKPLVRAYAFDRYGDTTFFDYDGKILHGYDVLYVKGGSEFFIFNANYKNAYLVIVVDRKTGEISIRNELDGLTLSAGEDFTVSDYCYSYDYEKGLALFNEFFPKRNIPKILGYTSWYNYYQDINEQIILRDLDALDDRFELFQIDDGYETFVGDWLDIDKVKFPNGLKGIVDKVHSHGMKAGIWLAPFVAEEKSKVFNEHRDWFSFGGEVVKCGANWSGFYAFNLDIPKARAYVEKCLRYYVELGFDFFKLDFLYGVNLPMVAGKTRSMVAESAYDFIRKVLKGKIILGCGATLLNAAGKFEYMRIGPDVSLKFDDIWYMRFMHNERISTKTTIQNTVFRSFMNDRLFGNDPDVFLLRDDNISLSVEQRRALVTVNALLGSVIMTSDDIANYDQAKKAQLDEALNIFRNAHFIGFARRRDLIELKYEIDGEEKSIVYNTKRGIIYDR